MQNKESYNTKSKAGRAITGGAKRVSEKKNQTGNQVIEGTIACVSGFLISMVHKTVKLISPCPASEQWPLGYIVFSEGTFTTGEEFRQLINQMVANQFQLTIPLETPMRFEDYLEYEPMEGGFAIKSQYLRKRFTSHPLFKKIGPLILDGHNTAGEILSLLAIEEGVSPDETLFLLNQIFQEGLIKN